MCIGRLEQTDRDLLNMKIISFLLPYYKVIKYYTRVVVVEEEEGINHTTDSLGIVFSMFHMCQLMRGGSFRLCLACKIITTLQMQMGSNLAGFPFSLNLEFETGLADFPIYLFGPDCLLGSGSNWMSNLIAPGLHGCIYIHMYPTWTFIHGAAVSRFLFRSWNLKRILILEKTPEEGKISLKTWDWTY